MSSPSVSPIVDQSQLNELLDPLGYVAQQCLTDTLQGQIWTVQHIKSQQTSILKVTSKQLHHDKVSMVPNYEAVNIQEDIVKEATVMKYLSKFQDYPSSIVGYQSFFESNKNYYLFMQHGGDPLFDFIVRAHDLLDNHRLDIAEWIRVVRCIFKQLIQALDFLHSHNVCHFDISLENMTIANDLNINVQNAGTLHEKVEFVNLEQELQAKIIDFGLAERFKSTEKQPLFRSSKFCGKRQYQSPELVQRTQFNAASNDIWCAGVCLFMMVAGVAPWQRAQDSDTSYKLIMNGGIKHVLRHWRKLDHFDADLLHLITCIFQPESTRISLAEIQKHPWLNPRITSQQSQVSRTRSHRVDAVYAKPIVVY